MPRCLYPLEDSERELGTWTTNFVLPDVARYIGDLTVTDRNLIFRLRGQVSMNMLASFLLPDFISGQPLYQSIGEDQYLVYPKEKIKAIIPQKSFLKKKIVLQTSEDRELVIDNGMLSIEPIIQALESHQVPPYPDAN